MLPLVWIGKRLGPRHLVQQALKRIPPWFQKKRGCPRMNWKKTLECDRLIDLTWSEATKLRQDCKEWDSRTV